MAKSNRKARTTFALLKRALGRETASRYALAAIFTRLHGKDDGEGGKVLELPADAFTNPPPGEELSVESKSDGGAIYRVRYKPPPPPAAVEASPA